MSAKAVENDLRNIFVHDPPVVILAIEVIVNLEGFRIVLLTQMYGGLGILRLFWRHHLPQSPPNLALKEGPVISGNAMDSFYRCLDAI